MPAFGPLYCALTDFFADNRGTPIGALRFQDDKVYKFVKNKFTSALAVGDVVFHGSNDLTLNEIYQLGQAAKGTAATLMAGVAISVIPVDFFGWIQVRGVNQSILTLGHANNAVGVSLKGVNATQSVTFDTAVATAATIARHIISLEAYTTVATTVGHPGIIMCL